MKRSSLYHSAFRVSELKNYHLHQHDAVWKHQIQYLVHLSIKNTKYLTCITFINVIQCLGNVVCNMGLIIYHYEKKKNLRFTPILTFCTLYSLLLIKV